MLKNDTLDRRCGCSNSTATEKAGYGAEHKTTHATKPVAAAATAATPLQLSAKNGPMPLLMGPELSKLIDHLWSGQPSHKDLPAVDANSAMLAGVIDLDDSVAKFAGWRLHDYFHVSPNA
ncbi:hypothetical protein [Luteimonas sp. 3794]|uniref:hypothetical protein n=1 Tax=Luteimonas sp. 3794 TaxID=2817730 RepID=UPI00285D8101|nr:hypothetical protein [Luteimonas sp. 3794]MDR6993294.1 hypothetical protein [Luteimonas sp. 3794]